MLSVYARTTKHKLNWTKMFHNALGHHLECFPSHFSFFHDTYGMYKDGILLKKLLPQFDFTMCLEMLQKA